MTPMFHARHSVLFSLFLVCVVCGSFAVLGNNLSKTEPGNLQIAESDSPREVLKKAISAAHSLKSYRVRVEAPSGSTDVSIQEYALPDRFRWFGKYEVISIGKDTYRRKGAGVWEKYPERTSTISGTNLPATAMENLIGRLAEAQDVEFIGQETVDGVPTLSYRHTMRSGNQVFTIKSRIGVADCLLRRCEFEWVIEGTTESSVVYTYYDYGADIKIEAPTKYVSVPFPGPETVDGEIRVEPKPSDLPRGVPGAPSLGPGRGGGMGPGRGTDTNPNAPAANVDSKPVQLNNPQPRYTERARDNKVEGTVLVRILIGSDGTVKRVTVVRGLPDGLDEQAIQAAYSLRFKPAMKDGQSVAYQLSAVIEFKLRK